MRRCKPKKRSHFRRRRNMSQEQRTVARFDTYAEHRESARQERQAMSFLLRLSNVAEKVGIRMGHKE